MADVLVIVFVCFCLLKQENFSSLTFMEFNNQLDQFETICAQKIVKNESIKNEYLFNECINDFLLSDIGDIEESNTTLSRKYPLYDTVTELVSFGFSAVPSFSTI